MFNEPLLLKDINPDLGDSSPENLTEANGILDFTANEFTSGGSLWKTDGTSEGIVKVMAT